jgi:hypothetical protein
MAVWVSETFTEFQPKVSFSNSVKAISSAYISFKLTGYPIKSKTGRLDISSAIRNIKSEIDGSLSRDALIIGGIFDGCYRAALRVGSIPEVGNGLIACKVPGQCPAINRHRSIIFNGNTYCSAIAPVTLAVINQIIRSTLRGRPTAP